MVERSLLAASLLIALLASPVASAAETDPYYAWLHPPRDSTDALNRGVNEILADSLRELNHGWRWRQMSCPEAAHALVRPLFQTTTMWFFIGAMDGFKLDYVPRSNTDYRNGYQARGIYRDSILWKLGFVVPPDPTIRIRDIHISPDKLGHFFHEGFQYFRAYNSILGDGRPPEEAHKKAIWHGIYEESWIQGDFISGIFSYADLEANEQGLRFYRSLCDAESPLLVKEAGGWRLLRELDFREYVNPCWDESYYTSAFDPVVGEGVRRALRDYCGVRRWPEIERMFRRYDAEGCSSFSYRYLEELAAAGTIPDRRPFTVEAVCEASSP